MTSLVMDAQDKSDEMGIAFNRDDASTYYLDQQSIPLSAKVPMAPPSAKMWYQSQEVGLHVGLAGAGTLLLYKLLTFYSVSCRRRPI